MSLPELSQKVILLALLARIDVESAAACRERRCTNCGGPLHDAHYERKPRGVQEDLPPEHMGFVTRWGLCCGHCRKRTLPPSALFLGRKVYWGQVVLVVMALRQRRPGSYSARKLRAMFGVSWRTVLRWMDYFREVFPLSEQWRRLRGSVSPVVRDDDLPAGLLDFFLNQCRSAQDGLVACLRFLACGHGTASP
jgi:hypothetical protein